MTMKTTTNAGKNQNFSRKVREEIVEAFQAISFSLNNLSMIHLKSSLSQRELYKLGQCDKTSKEFENTKMSKNFKIVFEILWHRSNKTNS